MANLTQAIEALQAERLRAVKELSRLDSAIRALQPLVEPRTRTAPKRAPKPRPRMSAAARRKIAAAQRKRWAKVRKVRRGR